MMLAHEYINLSEYSIEKMIEMDTYSNTYEIKETKSGKLHIAYISRYQIQDDSKEYNHFCKSEILKMSGLDLPSILKFEGFNIKDFDQKNRPTIITESTSSMTSLSKFLSNSKNKLDNTQKLNCIYGIASSMAYLHKKNITHSDLNLKTIFIDEFFHPKIMYNKMFKVIGKAFQNSREFEGYSPFFPAEITENGFYSKEDDVFNFSLILYRILYGHKKHPKKQNQQNHDGDNVVGDAFQKLFEKCNSEDPKERPTFSEITKKLRSKKEFISDDINSEIFFQYVDSIEGDNVSSLSESDIKSESNNENNVELENQNNNENNVEHENQNNNKNNVEHENQNNNKNNVEHENQNNNKNNVEHENQNNNENNVENENQNNNENNVEHENQNNSENNLICTVCQNKIDDINDIYYCRDHPYHINCIECRICGKNLHSANNDHFICVAPGLFFCQNDFDKYKNEKNDLPEEIQEEYLDKIVKNGIDELFNSFFDYQNINDDLINAVLKKGDNCLNILPINKYFKLFIPYVTFHFKNSPSQINFDELIDKIPEDMIIIDIEKGSTFLTIALIASNSIPNTEKEYFDIIEPLKQFFNSAIGMSIVGNIMDEPIIKFPDDESIKEFFSRESINLLQLKNILNKIDFNKVKDELGVGLKKKDQNKNWKFIVKYKSLYDKAEKAVRKDIKNNEIELILTGITIITNENYKEFRNESKKLSKGKKITKLFLYHGTKLNNHALIASSQFKHPDDINSGELTDCGQFGKGIYATDNVFYSLMYTNGDNNRYLQYNEKASVLCCKAFYDNQYCVYLNDTKNKFYRKRIFRGQEMHHELKQNYGIHKIFVESLHRFAPHGINNIYYDNTNASSKKSYVTAFEYVFPNPEQIVPVMSLTFMRTKYYVLWLSEKENEKVLNFLRYKSEVNIYYKKTIEKACQFVDLKIRNMLKLIISVEDIDLCRDFIDKIRKYHKSDFICLIFSTNKDLIKLSLEMVNVLFTDEIEYLYRFVKINMEHEEIEIYYKELEKKYNINFIINENDLLKFCDFNENSQI